MALRLTSCSPRRTALLPPSSRGTHPANLAPAPRRPNHTTSPYAQAAHVSRSSRVHRISPRVRDNGQRPSSAVRRRSYAGDLRENESRIFLRKGLDRIQVICPSCQFVAVVHQDCACRLSKSVRVASLRRVGKAKRAHHQAARSMIDGGHGASAPLPTLRTDVIPGRCEASSPKSILQLVCGPMESGFTLRAPRNDGNGLSSPPAPHVALMLHDDLVECAEIGFCGSHQRIRIGPLRRHRAARFRCLAASDLEAA